MGETLERYSWDMRQERELAEGSDKKKLDILDVYSREISFIHSILIS